MRVETLGFLRRPRFLSTLFDVFISLETKLFRQPRLGRILEMLTNFLGRYNEHNQFITHGYERCRRRPIVDDEREAHFSIVVHRKMAEVKRWGEAHDRRRKRIAPLLAVAFSMRQHDAKFEPLVPVRHGKDDDGQSASYYQPHQHFSNSYL